ncbi:hypothetical protein BJ508DRAFT_413184 [Ascobolus immersus RN42]|uniref:Ig-like domain-containing protein n=1 Tax=Ascobolus immersus RN42 TaxID=1160509 RepID=A0A3N4II69_ASCIM|nr:hypothetical protein BJ508DRAFT_413184 [Ascobolus immersus RN42]
MAKSARASTRKEAKRNIRAKVFDPVALERTERLSQKLLEIAAQAKPQPPVSSNSMDVDQENTNKSNAEEGRLSLPLCPPTSPLRIYSALHVPPSFLEWSSDDSGSEEEEEFYMQLGLVVPSAEEDEEDYEMSC